MRINIHDDNQNWLNWGNLVNRWINGAVRPTTVSELKQQMTTNHVVGTLQGADDRVVLVEDYDDDPEQTLVITIPTKGMRDDQLTHIPPGPGPYPLPLFYDAAYGGAARAILSQQEKMDLAMRRVGEYTINECC